MFSTRPISVTYFFAIDVIERHSNVLASDRTSRDQAHDVHIRGGRGASVVHGDPALMDPFSFCCSIKDKVVSCAIISMVCIYY